ncbi:hypothetical protein Tco_0266383 [Tanacetum coccineum]
MLLRPSSTGHSVLCSTNPHTEATTITTSLPEIRTPFMHPSAKIGKNWKQEMSEVKKKTITPADILERHNCKILIENTMMCCFGAPESIKNQESEKSPKEIIRTKREQVEEKQDST